jgi:hypothetical protein
VSACDDVRSRLGEKGYRYWLLGQAARYLPADPDDHEAVRRACWYLAKLLPDAQTVTESPATAPSPDPVIPPGSTVITHPGVAGDVTEVVNPERWTLIVSPDDVDPLFPHSSQE